MTLCGNMGINAPVRKLIKMWTVGMVV